MRNEFVLMMMLLFTTAPAPSQAQISIGIGLPNVSIGINLPIYPNLVPVPGYPVYYAPQLDSNYFFYDGMYWVYQGDNWYASSWYNGPWGSVSPDAVPLYVLRIPVRYYRHAPDYFRGWRQDAPPRWGDHWGNDWSQRRSGWDRWNHNAVPARPPLPTYQRNYSGDRYPRAEQQRELQSQHYRYQPRDPVVRQHVEAQRGPQDRQDRNPGQQDNRRYNPPPSPQQQGGPNGPRGQPPQADPRQQQQGQPQRQNEPQRGQPANQPRGEERESQDKGQPQEQNRGQRPGQGNDREREKGGDRGDKGDRGR